MGATEFLERRVDAVAEVLRRVDERAVEVKDEEFETVDRHRTKDANHEVSLTGRW